MRTIRLSFFTYWAIPVVFTGLMAWASPGCATGDNSTPVGQGGGGNESGDSGSVTVSSSQSSGNGGTAGAGGSIMAGTGGHAGMGGAGGTGGGTIGAGGNGGCTLDQQQTNYDGGTSARTLPGYVVWQSFTAGMSGTLCEIDMAFFNDMSGSGQLRIFDGEGTNGTVLQTLTVPVVATAQLSWNDWLVQVPVTAGKKYTFALTPDAATLPDPYGVAVGAGNPYAGGTQGLQDPSGSYPTDFDLVFRTFVKQ